MKKNNVWGLASLLLFAVALSFLVSLLRQGSDLRLGSVLRTVGLVLFLLFAAAVFFASKGRRLRMVLLLAAACGVGLLLGRLQLSRGMSFLIYLGVLGAYFLGCILFNYVRYRRALRPLNEAVQAYQQDHDGEKFLEALDHCAPHFPKEAILKRPDTGTITFSEHIICEKIEVLGKLGRLEERRELIERLRRETKSSGLPAWLDEKEAAFGIDSHRE